jgi:hypothetical protein
MVMDTLPVSRGQTLARGLAAVVIAPIFVVCPRIGAVTIAFLAGRYLIAYAAFLFLSAWRPGPEVGAR